MAPGQQLFEEILRFLDPSEFEDRTWSERIYNATTSTVEWGIGALAFASSPGGCYIRFGFLNFGRINRRSDVTSNCVLKPPGPDAGRCSGLAKRLGTKCCPRARRVISAEVSAQLLQALLLDLLHCDPPSLGPTDSPSTLPAGELRQRIKCGAWKLSRDRATQTDTDLLCFAE
jgi:hypothetical protein